jgi:hypothetical protein
VRENDYESQAKTVASLRQTNSNVKQVLANLVKIHGSILINHDLLKDNIKILKVKKTLLSHQIPPPKAAFPRTRPSKLR